MQQRHFPPGVVAGAGVADAPRPALVRPRARAQGGRLPPLSLWTWTAGQVPASASAADPAVDPAEAAGALTALHQQMKGLAGVEKRTYRRGELLVRCVAPRSAGARDVPGDVCPTRCRPVPPCADALNPKP